MSKTDRTNAQGEPFYLGHPRLTDLEARVGQVLVVVEVPGVVLHLATSAVLVYAMTLIVAELAGHGGSTGFVELSWAEVGRIAAGAVLMVLSTAAHELGHVVGRRVTGSGGVEMVIGAWGRWPAWCTESCCWYLAAQLRRSLSPLVCWRRRRRLATCFR